VTRTHGSVGRRDALRPSDPIPRRPEQSEGPPRLPEQSEGSHCLPEQSEGSCDRHGRNLDGESPSITPRGGNM
jgi:hypothetical protein